MENGRAESYNWDYEFCEADVVIPDYFETNADLYDNLWIIDDCKFETQRSWYEMPDELKNYIKSLPEYDAKIFKKITGVEL